MAAGKSSKDFTSRLISNRGASESVNSVEKEEKIKKTESVAKNIKKQDEEAFDIKPEPIEIASEPVKEIVPIKEMITSSKKEKKERVRDSSTILSLLLTPRMKSFIQFEARRRKMSMNEYVCNLIKPDYEKDKELFEEYLKYLEGMSKFDL